MRTSISLDSNNIDMCVPMYCAAFNEEPWNDGWSEAAALERLQMFTQIPNFHGLAFLVNDEPAAMLCGWGERWSKGWLFLIKELCVQPSYRRTGLGTKLVAEFEQILVRDKYSGVYLETLEGSSVEFYSSLKFRKLSLVMMKKDIS